MPRFQIADLILQSKIYNLQSLFAVGQQPLDALLIDAVNRQHLVVLALNAGRLAASQVALAAFSAQQLAAAGDGKALGRGLVGLEFGQRSRLLS